MKPTKIDKQGNYIYLMPVKIRVQASDIEAIIISLLIAHYGLGEPYPTKGKVKEMAKHFMTQYGEKATQEMNPDSDTEHYGEEARTLCKKLFPEFYPEYYKSPSNPTN